MGVTFYCALASSLLGVLPRGFEFKAPGWQGDDDSPTSYAAGGSSYDPGAYVDDQLPPPSPPPDYTKGCPTLDVGHSRAWTNAATNHQYFAIKFSVWPLSREPESLTHPTNTQCNVYHDTRVGVYHDVRKPAHRDVPAVPAAGTRTRRRATRPLLRACMHVAMQALAGGAQPLTPPSLMW